MNLEDSGNRGFKWGLAGLFLLSQLVVHLVWSAGGYRGAIEYHAGEAYEAYHAALNVERFGLRWAALQDMATSPDPAAHPYLYIHHPNFGLYFSLLLKQLGLAGFELQMAASTLLWSGGLVFFALLLRTLTGSPLLALGGAALIGLDPGNALEYGCNIHRANDFGAAALVVWCAIRFVSAPRPGRALGLLLALGFATGADYILFVFLTLFSLAVCAGVAVARWQSARRAQAHLGIGPRLGSALWPLVALGLLAAVVFGLRQGQVLAGAGKEVWLRDFAFQILNRTHNEKLYAGSWSHDTTNFYARQSVLNPGFAPLNPVSVRFAVITRTLSRNLGLALAGNRPSWTWTLGAGGWTIFLCLGLLGLALVRGRTEGTGTAFPAAGRYVVAAGILALLAMIFGLPTYFTQWFPIFRLPLFLAALFVGLACASLTRWFTARTVLVALGCLLAFKLSALPAARDAARELSLDHADFARGLRAGVNYSNFTSASLSAFTRTATCVPTHAGFLKLAAQGRLDQLSDFFFCLERDRYDNPAYFIPSTVVLLTFGDPAIREAMDRSPHFRRAGTGNRFVAYERK